MRQIISTFLILPIITAAFAATAALTPVSAAVDCNAEKDLQGNVTKNEATVTNHSSHDECVYDATLAVYDSPKEPETTGWIEAQKLIGSQTVTVKAGETKTLKIDAKGPSCWYQSDLIRGKDTLATPYYRNAMDTDVYKVTNDCKAAADEAKTPTQLAPTGEILIVYSFIIAGFVTLLAGLFLRKADK